MPDTHQEVFAASEGYLEPGAQDEQGQLFTARLEAAIPPREMFSRGDVLRMLRERHVSLFRQKDVAEAAGVSFNTVQRAEKNRKSVSLESWTALARALGTTVEELDRRSELLDEVFTEEARLALRRSKAEAIARVLRDEASAVAADSPDRSRDSPVQGVTVMLDRNVFAAVAGMWDKASPKARDEMYRACLSIAAKDQAAVNQGGEGNVGA